MSNCLYLGHRRHPEQRQSSPLSAPSSLSEQESWNAFLVGCLRFIIFLQAPERSWKPFLLYIFFFLPSKTENSFWTVPSVWNTLPPDSLWFMLPLAGFSDTTSSGSPFQPLHANYNCHHTHRSPNPGNAPSPALLCFSLSPRFVCHLPPLHETVSYMRAAMCVRFILRCVPGPRTVHGTQFVGELFIDS